MGKQDRFDVTFFNPLAGRRGILIDDVSESEADAVIAKFSDKKDKFHFLPEVRKEKRASA